ncbi:MAG: di-trans,poly-cis-decaprenylcistransferase [Acidobacteria bacterium]|nr:di-trans,poly-cis-decaprenylcistransferase [Acidobacteriota bacterium]
MQSTQQPARHVAVIMDGNGRWAVQRGRMRVQGHLAGADAVRRTVRAALALEIPWLTLFAFSCENWKRPAQEVDALMTLFGRYLRGEAEGCAAEGVRLRVIGRRDRLSPELREAVEAAEARTAGGTRLTLRLAVDYSARDVLARAARAAGADGDFAAAVAAAQHDPPGAPEIDLLIRTGGEKRVSDQLGWEAAYAELCFLEVMWPEFEERHLRAALAEFRGRERRFGGLREPGTDVPGSVSLW